VASDGREELLIEYFCDYPGCPNIATQSLGCVRDIRLAVMVCDEHAPKPQPWQTRNQSTFAAKPRNCIFWQLPFRKSNPRLRWNRDECKSAHSSWLLRICRFL